MIKTETPVLSGQAGLLDIVIEKGSTWTPDLGFRDPEDNVVDLTGFTARMQIRDTVDGTTIHHEITTENGGISIDGVNGIVTLLITDTDTTAITWTAAVYDLELISPTNIVTRVLKGNVTSSNEVTR